MVVANAGGKGYWTLVIPQESAWGVGGVAFSISDLVL
jgi:hypothetical protein